MSRETLRARENHQQINISGPPVMATAEGRLFKRRGLVARTEFFKQCKEKQVDLR